MTSIKFLPNEANTPVTILVAGDVRIDSGVGIYVSGARATDGTSGINGKGGYGGPGGFLGADGAYQLVNFANRGGDGLGPGGGTGGIPGTTPDHSIGEERYITFGISERGRLLVVGMGEIFIAQ